MKRIDYIISELQSAARDHDMIEAARIISETFTDSCCKGALFCRNGNCIRCLAEYLNKNLHIKGGC